MYKCEPRRRQFLFRSAIFLLVVDVVNILVFPRAPIPLAALRLMHVFQRAIHSRPIAAFCTTPPKHVNWRASRSRQTSARESCTSTKRSDFPGHFAVHFNSEFTQGQLSAPHRPLFRLGAAGQHQTEKSPATHLVFFSQSNNKKDQERWVRKNNTSANKKSASFQSRLIQFASNLYISLIS